MSIVDPQLTAACELDEIYRCLTAKPTPDYRETWRVFAVNETYRRELQSAAVGLLRAHRRTRERVAEVTQEALVVLAERLRERGDLGFCPHYGKERFLAWIRAVARSHCRHALDRQQVRQRCRSELDREWAACSAQPAAWRGELAEAVESLDEPLRAVAAAYWRLGSVGAVAEQLGLSTTTAWRRFRAAVRKLRSRLSPVAASGRLVGICRVVEKW
jgi:DNA-directed RNA polymerase specialized sigma24 family protein